MLKRVSEGLHRLSTGWVTLGALGMFLLFAVLVLPSQSATAPGVGSPDTSFFYTPDDLYRMPRLMVRKAALLMCAPGRPSTSSGLWPIRRSLRRRSPGWFTAL